MNIKRFQLVLVIFSIFSVIGVNAGLKLTHFLVIWPE